MKEKRKIEWIPWDRSDWEISFAREKAAELRATGEWDKVRIDSRGEEFRLVKDENGEWVGETRKFGRVFLGRYV